MYIAASPDSVRSRKAYQRRPEGLPWASGHNPIAVELCDLEWSQVEFDRAATLHVRRAKNGKPAAHPIRGDELRALRELQRQTRGSYVFETERGTPFTADAVNRLIKRIGERAGFPFKVHVHMLRHACGYALANAGMIRGQFRIGSAIARSNTPRATPNSARSGSKIFGAPDVSARQAS